jgi:hypothetical protein
MSSTPFHTSRNLGDFVLISSHERPVKSFCDLSLLLAVLYTASEGKAVLTPMALLLLAALSLLSIYMCIELKLLRPDLPPIFDFPSSVSSS